MWRSRTNVFQGGSTERKINRIFPGSLDQQDRDYYDVNGDTLRPYSVLIIGFDGMSRLNFERQMPRTMSILREQGGVSLLGYNKVGYNTFPNLMPVLTGRNISEIKDICWPSKYAVLDNCPFIWKTFKDYGYYTAYGEDNPLASTFIFSKSGFREQPVDYYMPPFFHEAETHLKTINFFKHTSVYCVGDKQNSARFVNAVQNFASRFKNKPTFALFWFNGMSHDFLNFPRIYDQLFYEMFSSFKEEGVLDSSIIIAMSDHGIRWGQFRQTFQGFLEERLPLATIVLPASFKKRFPRATANLELNTKRLTTPYDLYETMWDIVDVGRLPDRTIVDMNSIRQRGMSLFYPIPETRTCHSAGVPVEFCACDERKPMEENNEIKNFLATKAVSYQNLMLANATQCAKLKLLNVDAVWENVPHFGKESAIKILPLHRDFVLKFTTTPGNGVFEARIRFKLPNQLSIVGVISRLNMYHNDSACVDDEILKLYCYCLPNGEDGN
ncbi:unnamed protein product [Nesidiocoris tenuis]|uniref:Sulfatase N-terminal domain-containing protein n=1 Tax=Nesidiocoris tenuis TaxID=355587 RepID=A0A6H5HHM1_9HEMI|nr:unnamed protein product [Nesidiocoris tenuis]